MKKKIRNFIILLLFIILVMSNVAFIFRDIVEVYSFKLTKLPHNYFLKVFLSINTYIKFFKVHDNPNYFSWAISLYVFGSYVIGKLGILKVKESYEQADEYGSHGTSRFLKEDEIKNNYYNDKVGWFLGSYKPQQVYTVGMDAAYHALDQDLNMQMLIVGPPGTNKTTGFVLPNIFHLGDIYSKAKIKADLIITDPKSELYCLTSKYLKDNGYEVRVLDYIHLKYGDTLNSIPFISEEKELMEIADGYIDSVIASKGGKKSGEDFYPESTAQLLGALIGYVLQTKPIEKQTFTEIAQIITTDDVIDPELAKDFFKKANIRGAANQLWNNFLMAEDRTRANILIGLATKLKLFAIEGVQNITSSSTIDIKKFGAKKDKPIALFIFMSVKDKTFAPVINVTLTTILNQLYKTAYLYHNHLYNPVYFIIEEMANIGRLSNIEEMLGTMRGLRIYPMLIWQSLSQMRARYPESWEDIFSMCDTQVYLGVNDKFSAQRVSDDLGPTTIKVQDISTKSDGIYGVNSQSEHSPYQQRPLMFASQVRQLSRKKLILIPSGSYPSILEKVQYKYWIDKNKICDEASVFELPLLKKTAFEEFNFNKLKDVTEFTLDREELDINFDLDKIKSESFELNNEYSEPEDNEFNNEDIDIDSIDKEFDLSPQKEKVKPREIEEEYTFDDL